MRVLRPHSLVEPQGLAAGLPFPGDSCSLRELAALVRLCPPPGTLNHSATTSSNACCEMQRDCCAVKKQTKLSLQMSYERTKLLPALLMFRAWQLL